MSKFNEILKYLLFGDETCQREPESTRKICVDALKKSLLGDKECSDWKDWVYHFTSWPYYNKNRQGKTKKKDWWGFAFFICGGEVWSFLYSIFLLLTEFPLRFSEQFFFNKVCQHRSSNKKYRRLFVLTKVLRVVLCTLTSPIQNTKDAWYLKKYNKVGKALAVVNLVGAALGAAALIFLSYGVYLKVLSISTAAYLFPKISQCVFPLQVLYNSLFGIVESVVWMGIQNLPSLCEQYFNRFKKMIGISLNDSNIHDHQDSIDFGNSKRVGSFALMNGYFGEGVVSEVIRIVQESYTVALRSWKRLHSDHEDDVLGFQVKTEEDAIVINDFSNNNPDINWRQVIGYEVQFDGGSTIHYLRDIKEYKANDYVLCCSNESKFINVLKLTIRLIALEGYSCLDIEDVIAFCKDSGDHHYLLTVIFEELAKNRLTPYLNGQPIKLNQLSSEEDRTKEQDDLPLRSTQSLLSCAIG